MTTDVEAGSMVVVDNDTFQRLRRVLPAATRDKLQETFGVSETTWVKLREGRPLRQSTVSRLLARYERLVGSPT